MEYHPNNICYTINNALCTGCGVCEDVCPTQSIVLERVKKEYRPILNKQTCLSPKCGKCLKVCPGVGIDLKNVAKENYSESCIKEDKYIGRYVSLYTGYSCDETMRYHSASGGLLSQFLIYLLDKKVVDGVVVTAFSKEDGITPISYIARTKEEVLAARSSKYCPVALNKVGNEIVQSEGRYVIVGLPCHIQGFRKRAKIDRRFRENVKGYFAIYCSSNRTFNAQDFLLRTYKISKSEISYFAYRDNGCLGNLTIETAGQHRESKSKISIPFIHYYGRLRSFFKPRRCLTCIDHYGELADVCFGDIHIKPYSDDEIGISSCVVRSSYFDELFVKAQEEGYITISPVDAFTLNESQKVMLYPKKRKAKALMNMDRMLGRKAADYAGELDNIKPSAKDYLSMILTNAQRYIGLHKRLWFIIDYLYNK